MSYILCNITEDDEDVIPGVHGDVGADCEVELELGTWSGCGV
jgi:hypothetical protein